MILGEPGYPHLWKPPDNGTVVFVCYEKLGVLGIYGYYVLKILLRGCLGLLNFSTILDR
jgi:hypothetical protein